MKEHNESMSATKVDKLIELLKDCAVDGKTFFMFHKDEDINDMITMRISPDEDTGWSNMASTGGHLKIDLRAKQVTLRRGFNQYTLDYDQFPLKCLTKPKFDGYHTYYMFDFKLSDRFGKRYYFEDEYHSERLPTVYLNPINEIVDFFKIPNWLKKTTQNLKIRFAS